MRALHLGFIALTDAAPLIVAQARGFFEEEGLRVSLRREVSWATIRDKVSAGLYEGAHMLTPALLALNLGAGSEQADVIAPLSLGAHSASIGVSDALAAEMGAVLNATALAEAAARRRARGGPALSFAVVFPYSMHNYMLRAWVAEAGLDPDRDMRIVVAPPTAIAGRLRSGEIDGFCVGAPWGDVCAQESSARIVLDAAAFWPGGPDKVLGLSGLWASREPEAALTLTRAVLRAAQWADAPENMEDLVSLLAAPDGVGAPKDIIAKKLGAGETRIRFAREHAAVPWTEHACWMLSQMLRWRHVAPSADFTRAIAAYRRVMFEESARTIGLLPPAAGAAASRPASGAIGGAFDLDSLRRYAAKGEMA